MNHQFKINLKTSFTAVHYIFKRTINILYTSPKTCHQDNLIVVKNSNEKTFPHQCGTGADHSNSPRNFDLNVCWFAFVRHFPVAVETLVI